MATYISTLEDAPPGLLPTLTWRLVDNDTGTVVIPSVPAPDVTVTEQNIGATSTYSRSWSAPSAGSFKPVWNDPSYGGTGDIDDTVVIISADEFEQPSFAFTPSVDDVGKLLRARTKDNKGREKGTFTADTRPTALDAADLINQATADVAAATTAEIPLDLIADARSVSALRSAMLIELSYWPEQINNNMSAYQKYKDLFDEALKRLENALEEEGDGPPGGVDPKGNQIPMPSFSYPDDAGIGLGTQW